MTTEFQTALNTWLEKAQELISKYYGENFPTLNRPVLSVDEGGKKFLRIVRTDGSSRSVFAFIEVATGNVLKADSWKAPAKGARGNIYTAELGVTEYGAKYLR